MKSKWLIAVAIVACTIPTIRADDIWSRRDPRASRLFEDNLARNVGDVLTLAINETTEANEREQRALDKNSSARGGLAFSGKAGSGSGSMEFELGGSTGKKFNGSSQLSSDRKFIDRISVRVVDVLPNGNLVIEGFRSRIVAGERREIRLTGIVRPADISSQNLIESRFVANFRISYYGRGMQSEYVNPGWLKRNLAKFWPF